MKRKSIITGILLMGLLHVMAQERLLKDLEDSLPGREKVTAAFKSTRVINAHSMEMLAKGNLDFRILHRFDPVNDGVKQWFGLDHAYMRMAFDYGITDNFMIGVGRSTLLKEVDGFGKWRILQQTRGAASIPFSVLVAAGAMIWTDEPSQSFKPDTKERTSYYVQLIVGRKFSEKLSLQFSPMLLHRNAVDRPTEQNTLIAVGGGARFKISKRMALTADYHHALDGLPSANTDPLSIGVDIETGGHVFQLHFSNAIGMNERAYIAQTTNKFFDGDIRFGFNLSRIFKVGKKRK